MLKYQKIPSYILLIFNVLLLFFLLFEEKVQIPVWLSPVGRMHPILLHLPIGFVVLLVILLLFKNRFDKNTYQTLTKLLVTTTALTISIIAVMGFFLSKEGISEGNQLTIHKWMGAIVSFVTYATVIFYDKIQFDAKNYGSISLLLFITLAGHFGAEITHGENYLFQAFEDKKSKPILNENNSMYEAAIFPILEAKCVSCHNDNKTKGQLNMTTIAKILKGGKHGVIWKAGDALNSHIVQRAILPKDDKLHMPPTSKPQLTDIELAIITAWVNDGADTKKSFKAYLDSTRTKKLAVKLVSFGGKIAR
jgi:uncharacterized membrane protein